MEWTCNVNSFAQDSAPSFMHRHVNVDQNKQQATWNVITPVRFLMPCILFVSRFLPMQSLSHAVIPIPQDSSVIPLPYSSLGSTFWTLRSILRFLPKYSADVQLWFHLIFHSAWLFGPCALFRILHRPRAEILRLKMLIANWWCLIPLDCLVMPPCSSLGSTFWTLCSILDSSLA